LACERFSPPHRYGQEEVVPWVRRWLAQGKDGDGARRLLRVYAASGVTTRASVLPIEEVFAPAGFQERNDLYAVRAREAAVALVSRALRRLDVPPARVDLVVSASCTGFMIPAVEALLADELGMGPRLVRLPITEAGCAGGVLALARAADHLRVHPDRLAVVLALEFPSLTFQSGDRSPANVVATAIFGDGAACVVMAGGRHPLARRARALWLADESRFFPRTTHLMGFRLRNTGLQIVLDPALAGFVRREVSPAVASFLEGAGVRRGEVGRFVLHPGGRRIVDALREELSLSPPDLAPTEAVLAAHGNMSSATVLFVLDEVLKGDARPGELGLLAAFGPGFGAELGLVRFA
jgi:alkylresorcinol/alkylpyrone synthase